MWRKEEGSDARGEEGGGEATMKKEAWSQAAEEEDETTAVADEGKTEESKWKMTRSPFLSAYGQWYQHVRTERLIQSNDRDKARSIRRLGGKRGYIATSRAASMPTFTR